MPELPEVESFVRALAKEYVGKTITQVVFHRDNLRDTLNITALRKVLAKGVVLGKIFRDGKQLVLQSELGEISVSLGMSGSFTPASNIPAKHEHITIHFTDDSALGYVDPRRFGNWKIRTEKLAHHADPMESSSLKKLLTSERLKKSERNIKDVLLDQHEIGGVGNIYALEALHLAGINPKRKISTLKLTELTLLSKTLPKVLKQAIDKGGSTISTYRRLHGDSGNFQELHRVYGREGEKCIKRSCGGKILRIKQSGRSSWYCPKCQK